MVLLSHYSGELGWNSGCGTKLIKKNCFSSAANLWQTVVPKHS
jgi:hypothetical protein